MKNFSFQKEDGSLVFVNTDKDAFEVRRQLGLKDTDFCMRHTDTEMSRFWVSSEGYMNWPAVRHEEEIQRLQKELSRLTEEHRRLIWDKKLVKPEIKKV